MRKMADQHGVPGVAMTFYPHPAEVLAGREVTRILPIEDRIGKLLAAGVDGVWVVPFTREFSTLEPETFVENFLVRSLEARGVVIGPDFRFGKGRRGDGELMTRHAQLAGFELVQLDPHEVNGVRISSSQIREVLKRGDVEHAALLLGNPFRVKGEVVHGEGRGRHIGFPTANVAPYDKTMLPARGIYVVRARLGAHPGESEPMDAVASVGTRPTFDDGLVKLEVFILDRSFDIYGETLTVEFLHRLRDEEKYATVDDLIDAIQKDVDAARDYLSQH